MSNRKIEKLIFWDYAEGAFDVLPGITVAQRIVDRWAIIDEAYKSGAITKKELIETVKRVAGFTDEVVFCESVREYVIKNLIERYVKNTA